MKNYVFKIVLGSLALAGIGFVGYRYMNSRDNVEIQSTQHQAQLSCSGSHSGTCPSGQKCVGSVYGSSTTYGCI